MGSKRKSETLSSPNKRQRDTPNDKPQLNRVYGQTGAFPGLDGTSSETGSVADDQELPEDPIQYLKRVRKEANAIPTLLTVSDPHQKDSALLYGDGAIVAAPFIGPPRPPASTTSQIARTSNKARSRPSPAEATSTVEEGEEQDDIHSDDEDDGEILSEIEVQRVPAPEAYRTRLVAEYHRVHQLLASTSVAESEPVPARRKQAWLETMRHSKPRPAQLAALADGDIFTAMEALTHTLKWRDLTCDADTAQHTQAWIWALLARLDVKSMDYEDVGRVRELGKKAVKMLAHPPKSENTGSEDEQHETGNGGAHPNASGNGQVAETSAHDAESTETTRSTKMLDALPGAQEEDRRLLDAVDDAAREFDPNFGRDALHLITKWCGASDGLRELCERLRDVDGGFFGLDEDDRVAFVTTVSTAAEEAREHQEADEVSGGDQRRAARDDNYEDRRRSGYAALDMILTVVGDVFGQRDLLEESRALCWATDA